jgi:hypothetical protein
MQAFVFNRRFWATAGVVLFVVPAVAALLVSALGLEATAGEGGPLELAQEALLIVTALIYAAAAARQRQAERMASVGATVLSVVFFLREFDRPVTGAVTAYLDSPSFRWHETSLVVAIAVIYLAFRWRLVPVFVRYLRALHAGPYVLVAALLFAGGLMDGRHWLWGIAYLPTAIEETAETAAYLIFLLTGLHVFRAARRAHALLDMPRQETATARRLGSSSAPIRS